MPDIHDVAHEMAMDFIRAGLIKSLGNGGDSAKSILRAYLSIRTDILNAYDALQSEERSGLRLSD